MSATDSRRKTAEHNLTAILDAAERLLARNEPPTISAVATEAGVSRPTVYAHFPDRRVLLEALVERTVRQTMTAISSTQPQQGPADDALQRLLTASWQQLEKHDRIAHAAAADLSPESMRAAHRSAREAIHHVIERGREDGSVRTDLATSWLVTATLALIHAAAEEVRAGGLAPNDALHALSLTIANLVSKSEDPDAR